MESLVFACGSIFVLFNFESSLLPAVSAVAIGFVQMLCKNVILAQSPMERITLNLRLISI